MPTKGHIAILTLISEKPSEEKRLEDIPIVRNFSRGIPGGAFRATVTSRKFGLLSVDE